jgi:penicillin-binding protein 1A
MIVLDVELDIRRKQQQNGNESQLISPQNAYVMTGLLKKTVEIGTLGGQGSKFVYVDDAGKRYRIAAAGKTGTTQNWSDAWTVGFTPYYTTAIWFGFDRPGNSLGLSLTGATLAGPIWGDFMREVHQGLPAREFTRPDSGVVDVTVCAKSGQLLTSACNSGAVTLTFLAKNRPSEYCSYHRDGSLHSPIPSSAYTAGDLGADLNLPTLNLPPMPNIRRGNADNANQQNDEQLPPLQLEDDDAEETSETNQAQSNDTQTNQSNSLDLPALPNLDDIVMPDHNFLLY